MTAGWPAVHLFGALLICAAAQAADFEPLAMEQVAPGIFVRAGLHDDATSENDNAIANIGFIVGDSGVAAIDPGGSRQDGERLRATIRSTTRLPILYVIMTHAHSDHTFGASAFLSDHPAFVGHHNLARAFANRGAHDRRRLEDILGTDRAGIFVAPTMSIAASAEIDLGSRKLELVAHPTAHSDNDLTVFDRRTRTLWAGDLVFVDRIPSIDGSVLGWLKELQALKALPALRVVPGHGPASVPWPAGALDEERYLSRLVQDVRSLLAEHGDIETAVATIGLSEQPRWRLFDAYNGRNVTTVFKELEWE